MGRERNNKIQFFIHMDLELGVHTLSTVCTPCLVFFNYRDTKGFHYEIHHKIGHCPRSPPNKLHSETGEEILGFWGFL